MMKRSTQIGLAASGVVLTVVAASTFLNREDDVPQTPEMQACMISGTMTRSDCVAAFRQAQVQFKELQMSPPAENAGNEVSQDMPHVAAPVAPPASSGSSNNGFWTGYFIRSMLDSNTGRGSDYGRAYAPSAPSSGFNRSGNPSSYHRSPNVVRPVPSAPSVASRGGFGTTARSMGMGASS